MIPYYSDQGVEIYLGDALNVLIELEDPVGCVAMDPPYCSGGRQIAAARGVVSKNISRQDVSWFLGDNMGGDSYLWWMRQVAAACFDLATAGSQAFIFSDWRQTTTITMAWESSRWTLQNLLVWDKAKGGALGSFWRNNHELVPIFTKGKPRELAHRSCFNTWRGTKPQGGRHPTEKPLELMEYILSTVKAGEGPILDPFMGSGTTAVACRRLGLPFIGIEINEEYCELTAKRLAQSQLDL